jgi:hypothetical protein
LPNALEKIVAGHRRIPFAYLSSRVPGAG